MRLEYITNVLFKNRVYRLSQDPDVEDVGLKNIGYAKNKQNDEDSEASTHHGDGKKQVKNPNLEEFKHHQTEREKQKELHKSIKTAASTMIKHSDKSKVSKILQVTDGENKTSEVMELAEKMTDQKSKKQIKKMLRILNDY